MESWQAEIREHLANLHPTQIIEEVIKSAVQQVIEDYMDALILYERNNEREQFELHRKLIEFWEDIQKRINKEGQP
jgi:hypothetical protein